MMISGRSPAKIDYGNIKTQFDRQPMTLYRFVLFGRIELGHNNVVAS